MSIKTLSGRISDVFWRKEYLWKSCKYMRILRKISNCKWESNVKNHYVISREIYLNNLCILSLMCSCQHAAYIMHFSELDGSTAAGAVWRSLLSSHGKSPTPCRKWPNWIQYSCPAQLCFLYHIQLDHFQYGGGDFTWEDIRNLNTAPAAFEPSNSEKCMMYAGCTQLHIKLKMLRLLK